MANTHYLKIEKNTNILVPHSLCESMGLRAGMNVFGCWIDSAAPLSLEEPPESTEERADESNRELSEFPHFVVSRIPPNFWPSCANITILLSRDDTAIERCLNTLEPHVDIIHGSAVQSGYQHQKLSIACRMLKAEPAIHQALNDLANDLQQIALQDLPTKEIYDKSADRRKSAFAIIGKAMVDSLAMAVVDLFLEDLSPKGNAAGRMLHKNVLIGGHEPWYLEEKDAANCRPDMALQESVTGGKPKTIMSVENYKDFKPFLRLDQLLHSSPYGKRSSSSHNSMAFDRASPSGYLNLDYDAERLAKHAMWRQNFLLRIWHENWVRVIQTKALLPLAYARLWAKHQGNSFETFTVGPADALHKRFRGMSLTPPPSSDLATPRRAEDKKRKFSDIFCEMLHLKYSDEVARRIESDINLEGAICSYDAPNNLLRLRIVRNATAEKSVFVVNIEYRVDFASARGDSSDRTTKGMGAAFVSCLNSMGIKMISINVHNHNEKKAERGTLNATVRITRSISKDQIKDQLTRAIQDDYQAKIGQVVQITAIEITDVASVFESAVT